MILLASTASISLRIVFSKLASVIAAVTVPYLRNEAKYVPFILITFNHY